MNSYQDSESGSITQRILESIRLDPMLIFLISLLVLLGVFVVFSASGENTALLERHAYRIGLATFLLIVVANIALRWLQAGTFFFYLLGVGLLVAVIFFGEIGKGAQRWINFGFIRFQPSEILKLAVPMMVAYYLSDKILPVGLKDLMVSLLIVFIPVLLIAKQPDLGTAILVGSAGFFVLFIAGIRWRILIMMTLILLITAPVLWKYALHDYQKTRIMTMLDPESDPLGSGYHIIQSKIAIGSGGTYGKGWLNGTQSQLDFLPERSTDFIFAVFSEEFGFIGVILLLILYLLIILRGLVIAAHANNTFGRLLAGALSMTFFVYLFVNTGMVSGLLPVVGVPLPLVSYGGTSIVTLMIGFGMIMSIRSSKRFLE
ncbi:MAG: rod shape-determining protein RodA [Gammaproteobacteria bacterium]|nr:rod shape-determining protein RodA [Gammaproteobacteria bacterium]